MKLKHLLFFITFIFSSAQADSNNHIDSTYSLENNNATLDIFDINNTLSDSGHTLFLISNNENSIIYYTNESGLKGTYWEWDRNLKKGNKLNDKYPTIKGTISWVKQIEGTNYASESIEDELHCNLWKIDQNNATLIETKTQCTLSSLSLLDEKLYIAKYSNECDSDFKDINPELLISYNIQNKTKQSVLKFNDLDQAISSSNVCPIFNKMIHSAETSYISFLNVYYWSSSVIQFNNQTNDSVTDITSIGEDGGLSIYQTNKTFVFTSWGYYSYGEYYQLEVLENNILKNIDLNHNSEKYMATTIKNMKVYNNQLFYFEIVENLDTGVEQKLLKRIDTTTLAPVTILTLADNQSIHWGDDQLFIESQSSTNEYQLHLLNENYQLTYITSTQKGICGKILVKGSTLTYQSCSESKTAIDFDKVLKLSSQISLLTDFSFKSLSSGPNNFVINNDKGYFTAQNESNTTTSLWVSNFLDNTIVEIQNPEDSSINAHSIIQADNHIVYSSNTKINNRYQTNVKSYNTNNKTHNSHTKLTKDLNYGRNKIKNFDNQEYYFSVFQSSYDPIPSGKIGIWHYNFEDKSLSQSSLNTNVPIPNDVNDYKIQIVLYNDEFFSFVTGTLDTYKEYVEIWAITDKTPKKLFSSLDEGITDMRSKCRQLTSCISVKNHNIHFINQGWHLITNIESKKTILKHFEFGSVAGARESMYTFMHNNTLYFSREADYIDHNKGLFYLNESDNTLKSITLPDEVKNMDSINYFSDINGPLTFISVNSDYTSSAQTLWSLQPSEQSSSPVFSKLAEFNLSSLYDVKASASINNKLMISANLKTQNQDFGEELIVFTVIFDNDKDGIPDDQDLDDDNDGLPDVYELAHNLNPMINDANIDSDNDGMSNLDEFYKGTNPVKADSDDDGFSDLEEILNNTNPLNANDIPINISSWLNLILKK